MAQQQTQTQTQTQTTQTQPPAGAPLVVRERSFGQFSFFITLLLIAAIFCVVYFSLRRKRSSKHVDEKAGDEGED